MKVTYGLAEFDRFAGRVDFNVHLPMEGVEGGGLYEFLESAGKQGWELCSSFSSSIKGNRRQIPGMSATRVSKDAAEQISLIFIKR